MPRIRRPLARLGADRAGVTLIEFALAMPVLLAFGLGGIEMANYTIAHMRVSQIALTTADNASRVRTSIDEADINELFLGARISGESIELVEKGRIILSSLEMNAKGDGQWIRWQRCIGDKDYASTYGKEGDGEFDKKVKGMGKPDRRVAAMSGTSVMFVELAYDYEPIIPNSFTSNKTIIYTAAFNVRDRGNKAMTNLGNASKHTC